MTLIFYMKSGNRLKLRGVASYELTTDGILKLKQLVRHPLWPFWPFRIGEMLIVGSFDMKQIEAVTVVR